MTVQELFELRNSPSAPFDHMEYTVWLHNQIIDEIFNKTVEIRKGLEPDDTADKAISKMQRILIKHHITDGYPRI